MCHLSGVHCFFHHSDHQDARRRNCAARFYRPVSLVAVPHSVPAASHREGVAGDLRNAAGMERTKQIADSGGESTMIVPMQLRVAAILFWITGLGFGVFCLPAIRNLL